MPQLGSPTQRSSQPKYLWVLLVISIHVYIECVWWLYHNKYNTTPSLIQFFLTTPLLFPIRQYFDLNPSIDAAVIQGTLSLNQKFHELIVSDKCKCLEVVH